MPDRPADPWSRLPIELLAAVGAARTSPEGPAAALAALCAQFPEHASAIAAYAEAMAANEQSSTRAAPWSPTPAHGADMPATIGPYRILEVLGEGGMGTVYLAEQRHPVQRRVALKTIKLGMDSRAVLARFEAERQALSRMDHSCVARIYDAGLTTQGRPYFVMELVKGLPITRYCDQRKLSIPARLDLFRSVCAGVQHAHGKGVLHRDLKPSNILVAEQDGRPVPKIIDFGLAKAMDQRWTVGTVFTAFDQVIGTPAYMSPEQAGVDALDVDARTDVYSLGVLLYELLTGSVPFQHSGAQPVGLLEMQRVLRETAPPKPSTRVTTLADAGSACAMARGLAVGELQRRLRGDLDWIVLKALAKDRAQRYETPLELAADLQRHLQHLPTLASPPSASYRLGKFLERYRSQVIAAAVVLVASSAGTVGTFVQYQRAEVQAGVAGRQAEQNAELLRAEQRTAAALAESNRNYDLLSCLPRCDRVLAAEESVFPPSAGSLPAMDAWLQECDAVLAMAEPIERALSGLRACALPATADELEADRRSQAWERPAAWQEISKRFAFQRRAGEIRRDFHPESSVVPELPAAALDFTALDLNRLAWARVSPDPADRTVPGDEAFGLECARRALQKVAAGDTTVTKATVLDTLAWALASAGQYEAGRQHAAEAVQAAVGEEQEAIRASAARLDAWPLNVQVLQQIEGALELPRRQFRFALPAQQLQHDTLRVLVEQRLPGLRAARERVASARAWSQRLEALTLRHPSARFTWAEAAAAIRAADDRVASRLYSGPAGSAPIDLPPQPGLVPIGRNPRTGLWEFYDLRSAWESDGVAPEHLAIPSCRADGTLDMTAASGLVFVLLPGGTFRMGAQATDPAAPDYDPDAEGDEGPVWPVTLAPVFVSRFEMTRGQWRRLTGEQPWAYGGDEALPVENVSWHECMRVLGRWGMTLPTEAQWEYAARGGLAGPRPGVEVADLAKYANLWDAAAAGAGSGVACLPWHDGHRVLAPVGSLAPNPFGLHDMLGNVGECCLDASSGYERVPRAGDGLRWADPRQPHVVRGADFTVGDPRCIRFSYRYSADPADRGGALGVRPARPLGR